MVNIKSELAFCDPLKDTDQLASPVAEMFLAVDNEFAVDAVTEEVETPVTRPLLSTVITGINEADPKVPAVAT